MGIGRQEGSDTYVFGPNIQFWTSGDPIPVDEQKYIWIPEILSKIECPMNDLLALPTVEDPNPLHFVLCGMRKVLGRNILSGINMLGMY